MCGDEVEVASARFPASGRFGRGYCPDIDSAAVRLRPSRFDKGETSGAPPPTPASAATWSTPKRATRQQATVRGLHPSQEGPSVVSLAR
jgi:hypothetical protein